MRKLALALGILCSLSAVANAASTITVGNYVFNPDTTGNVVTILASGNDQAAGVNLILQSNDGVTGPLITSADVVGPGTIFNASNTGQVQVLDPPPGRQIWTGTTTVSGFLSTNGVLAFLTIDTTGVAPGVYNLLLSIPEFEVSTDWADPNAVVVPQLINGTITVVPEPGSIVLGLFAAAGIGAVAIRKRRARISA